MGNAISLHGVGIFERYARSRNVLDETSKVNGNVAFDVVGAEVWKFVPFGLLLGKDVDRSNYCDWWSCRRQGGRYRPRPSSSCSLREP